MKKMMLMPLTLFMFTAASSCVHASVIPDSSVTIEKNLVFMVNASGSGEIVPIPELTPGIIESSATLASAHIKASAGSLVFRWTPGSGVIDVTKKQIIVDGLTKTNKLKLRFQHQEGTMELQNEGWLTISIEGTLVSQAVVRIKSTEKQDVAADIYKLSIDVAAWQN